MVEDCLEKWNFGWEFLELRGGAIDDVSDGSAVCVDGVILLWREMPAAEG